MEELWNVYDPALPPFLAEAACTPPLLRLRRIGMNCGCEYTAFRRFAALAPYSRYDHSVGVGLIVWHFTRDEKQALAGLLHDVATPVFAHVVDFLRGDYLTQESTEDGTRELIDGSPELQRLLRKCGLCTDEVCDYHRYPIADNDAPRLSADRLEYTLGNLINFGLCGLPDVRRVYEDITVCRNEEDFPELAFRDAATALRFAEGALACSRIYVSDEDRYSMQMLAELLREAIAEGVLSQADLMLGEPELLEKLCLEPAWALRWQEYRRMQALERTDAPDGDGWRRIDAKRRRIDPLIAGQGRVSARYPDFGAELREFAGQPFDYWIRERKPK